MQYRLFNGYKIPPLILGTVQLGMEYGIANIHGRPSVSEAHELLRVALQQGIHTLDTSPTYGTSESVIGDYIRSAHPTEITVITKFKCQLTSALSLEKAWLETLSTVKGSLQQLGIPQIPILLYHKAGNESMEVVKTIVPELLNRLKNEGLIAYGGLSLYYSSEANDLVNDSSFDALQIPMNVLDQAIMHNGTLDTLHQNGKLIMIRSVFLQGLFWREPESLPQSLQIAIPYLQKIKELAQEYQLSIAELTLGFIRDILAVDSLVIGAETVEQLAANIQLLQGPTLPNSLRDALTQLSNDVPLSLITPGLW